MHGLKIRKKACQKWLYFLWRISAKINYQTEVITKGATEN